MKFQIFLKKTSFISLSLIIAFILSQCSLETKKGPVEVYETMVECKVGLILISTSQQTGPSKKSIPCWYENDDLKLKFTVLSSSSRLIVIGVSNGNNFHYTPDFHPRSGVALRSKSGSTVFLKKEEFTGNKEVEGLVIKLKDKSVLLDRYVYEIQSLPK